LCSSANGVAPFSALRNTAVPGTRSGGLMNTASRKARQVDRLLAQALAISARPCFQVIISRNITPPITSGNQPPSSTLTALAAKKVMSTTKKKPVDSRHRPQRQLPAEADHEEGHHRGDGHVDRHRDAVGRGQVAARPESHHRPRCRRTAPS
jgi:hypothetical protein